MQLPIYKNSLGRKLIKDRVEQKIKARKRRKDPKIFFQFFCRNFLPSADVPRPEREQDLGSARRAAVHDLGHRAEPRREPADLPTGERKKEPFY